MYLLVFKTGKTNAEMCKDYDNRMKTAKEAENIPQGLSAQKAKTSAERSRAYRLRKKMLSQVNESSVTEILSIPSTSNSRIRTSEPSFQLATTSATANRPDVSTVPSTGIADNDVFNMGKTNAEMRKDYYNRKKAAKEAEKIPQGLSTQKPKTITERSRAYRLRKKMLSQVTESSVTEILSIPSTSNSRIRTSEPSFQLATTSASTNRPDGMRHLLPNNNRTIENVEHIIIDDDSNNSFVQEEGTYQCDTGKHLSDNHVQSHRTCLEVVAELRKQLQDQINQWESFMMLSPLDLIVKGTAQIKTMKVLIDKLEAAVSSCTTSETSNENSLDHSQHITMFDDNISFRGTYQCDTGKHLSDNHVQSHRTCLEVVAELRKQLQDQLNQWESFMMLSPLDLIVKGTAQIKTMKALIDKLEAAVSSCTTSETSNENSLDHSQHITMLDDNISFRSTNSSEEIEKLTADTAQAHFQTLFKKITEGNKYI